MTRETRETVTIMQACARLDVSRRTVYNWLRDGKVEFARTAGGSIRIFADTLLRPATGTSRAGYTNLKVRK